MRFIHGYIMILVWVEAQLQEKSGDPQEKPNDATLEAIRDSVMVFTTGLGHIRTRRRDSWNRIHL
jgi:hypothetical protein